MNLSSDFHANKKSGELYASIDQGRSINGFIDDVCFSILPMLVDLIVAFGYFYYLFDAYMALIVGVVTVVYLWVTTKLGAQQDQIRRDYRTSCRNENHVLYESMGSWSTVSVSLERSQSYPPTCC
jgi:ABC-type transport system involved in Fe-S cluster assembly fused permease/ATPase subunit